MLRIELPFPAKELMPNKRLGRHWSVTKEAKSKAFGDAYVLAHQAFTKSAGNWHPTNGTVPVPVTLTFHQPDRHHRDLDNLLAASKHFLDGIAAALLMDDRQFDPVTVKRGDIVKNGMLVVEVGE